MKDIVGQLQVVRDELSNVGIDTTGEGAKIPAGFVRIHDELAQFYAQAGHTVERCTALVNNQPKMVTVFAIGDPEKVAQALSRIEIYPAKAKEHEG